MTNSNYDYIVISFLALFDLINEYLFFIIVQLSCRTSRLWWHSDLGYEGQELREYVAKEQAILREERKEKRGTEKEQYEFERARHEADLAAQREQREHELLLAKERFDTIDATSDSRHSRFP